MLSKTGVAGLLLLLVLPIAGAAQTFELTPFVAFRYGGDFFDGWRFDDWSSLEVDDGIAYGLILGFDVSDSIQLEAFWSHQPTELFDRGSWLAGDERVFDLDADYFHFGALYRWHLRHVTPFAAASIGVTVLDPEPGELDEETDFSTSLGGGIQIEVAEHFGFRLEGRLFSTFVDETGRAFCGCQSCENNCLGRYNNDYFSQGEIRAGLTFAF